MCNDYERHIEWKAYCDALAAAGFPPPAANDAALLTKAADVRVRDSAPILVARGNGTALADMTWGFAPQRAGGSPVFNFRSEGRHFGDSKRCLVPTSAFFEFTGKAAPKSKWRFALPGAPVFAVAGLWREQDGAKPAFTMLTTAPGPDIAPFHDRQIVVLPPAAWGDWLYLTKPEEQVLGLLPGGSLTVELARAGKEEPAPELAALAREDRVR
ncbi:SOS response-associated peptidase family protein [Parablastomonas sp. CN1-191]|uniref:SOS response-associated peptidase family protein n=1 Tax=Parablastomonas sp. CN1-191 TaxID=3400908 RepID=UPI003BF88299